MLNEDVQSDDAETVFRRHLRSALEKSGFSGHALELEIEKLIEKGKKMPFDWKAGLPPE